MPRRLLYGFGALLFIVSVALIVWQGSFPRNFEAFAPDDPDQTFLFYGISILIVLVFVGLGFMLVRMMLKLWIERRNDRAGSRIRTKLVIGALALNLMPVFFMWFFTHYVLSVTLTKWFSRPVQHELVDFEKIKAVLEKQTSDRAAAEAQLLAAMPETKHALAGAPDAEWLARFCRARGILAAAIFSAGNPRPADQYGEFPGTHSRLATVATTLIDAEHPEAGSVRLAIPVPLDAVKQQLAIEEYDREFERLNLQQKSVRRIYLLLLTLIALFILFVAGWLAQYLARQISGPISALLHAAEEVSKGNLAYRVKVNAVDELAQLVSGFNRMTADLEANRTEIDARRRFTEAILESIPTGVISIDSNGGIRMVNKALTEIFPHSQPLTAARLEDLFIREDVAEIRYLMNRARRTGHAAQQLEVKAPGKTLHLAVTVSAIEGRRGSGFVIVIEDTSDLLRAQRTAAWSEVARRVAHEIRNPLTPITLSAERIIRQINRQRAALPPTMDKVVRECAETILEETESVKRLVDEFVQFSRLPAAQLQICELNDVVANGISVFEGRLEGIDLRVDLAPGLPPVMIDPAQFKRVVVNLIDNAAEAMQDSPTRVLTIQTRAVLSDSGSAELVEIIFADTGCGITAEQKEKLFLPYFSTKGRGTGLGLAIVSHILTEHQASIRVEDNTPCGAWFTIEVPAAISQPEIMASVNTALI